MFNKVFSHILLLHEYAKIHLVYTLRNLSYFLHSDEYMCIIKFTWSKVQTKSRKKLMKKNELGLMFYNFSYCYNKTSGQNNFRKGLILAHSL